MAKDDLDDILDEKDPFADDVFHEDERPKQKRKRAPRCKDVRLDAVVDAVASVVEAATVDVKPLSLFDDPLGLLDAFQTADGHTKYTCSFCELEYDGSQVKEWWRKPDNVGGKSPIPMCPDRTCKNAGAVIGWGIDWSRRREKAAKYIVELAERRERERERTAKQREERLRIQAERAEREAIEYVELGDDEEEGGNEEVGSEAESGDAIEADNPAAEQVDRGMQRSLF